VFLETFWDLVEEKDTDPTTLAQGNFRVVNMHYSDYSHGWQKHWCVGFVSTPVLVHWAKLVITGSDMLQILMLLMLMLLLLLLLLAFETSLAVAG